MVAFVPGRAVTTRVPAVLVDPGLPAGLHRFQLVVIDTAGLRSRPDVALVRIAAGVLGPLAGPPGATGHDLPTKSPKPPKPPKRSPR